MKTPARALVGFLILNALMPIAFTVIGLVSPAALLSGFGIAATTESVAAGALFPSFTLVVAAWTLVAIAWLLRGKREGLTMAMWLGALCVAAGVMNGLAFATLGRNPLVDAPDFVRGLCILALCAWASCTAKLATPALAS